MQGVLQGQKNRAASKGRTLLTQALKTAFQGSLGNGMLAVVAADVRDSNLRSKALPKMSL
jgi:hypothetical protein